MRMESAGFVTAVVMAITAAFGAYGVAVGSPFVAYYVPITVVVAGVVVLIHRSARFSPGVMWGLAGVAVGNLAGGVLLVRGDTLYVLKLVGDIRYDKPFHAAATGVAAWASLEAISRWTGRPQASVRFAAVLMAAGAGSLVEIVEYLGSIIFESTNVGDYGNNMLDLVANLIGAVIAVSLVRGGRTIATPTAAGSP